MKLRKDPLKVSNYYTNTELVNLYIIIYISIYYRYIGTPILVNHVLNVVLANYELTVYNNCTFIPYRCARSLNK